MNKEVTSNGSIEQNVKDLYNSGMNIDELNKEGNKALMPYFADIDTISDTSSFAAEVAKLQLYSSSPLFGIGASPDKNDSDIMIMNVIQGGLGLPSDYYMQNDDNFKNFRKEYVKYISRLFVIYGYDKEKADHIANRIMSFETELALISRTPEQLRDTVANYNKMTLHELNNISPVFNWQKFFAIVGFNNQTLNVGQPEFFKGMNDILNKTSMEDLKNYLKWNVLNSMAPYLGTDYFKASFDFYYTVLSGVKEMKPRWKIVIDSENAFMGEAIGQFYVKEYFPSEVKKKALIIVRALLDSLKERISHLKWMSDATKQQVLKKLSMFTIKIGYPDKWIDYSKLEITPDSYTQNCLAAIHFNVMRDLDKIGKPTDRTEWGMNPQTVNAYYNPQNNEIVFPAAILQSPFFNPEADDAINYGSMGAVIGHEITHGFDDQGRMFDGKGDMKNWWNDSDSKNFKDIASKLSKQFDTYEPLAGYHINGNLTLGENIADLGGLIISYNAFIKTDEFLNAHKITVLRLNKGSFWVLPNYGAPKAEITFF